MFTIRNTTARDAPIILEMIRLLAEYEKQPEKVACSVEDLVRDGFGAKPLFECILAEEEGRAVGFALYYFKWSTWTGAASLHLEDLFVVPAYRGKKIGFELLGKLSRIAVERRCQRMEWDVLDWNMLARDFYHRIGAVPMDDWLTYRLDGEALSRFAGSKKGPAGKP